jgi:hypothetical protein
VLLSAAKRRFLELLKAHYALLLLAPGDRKNAAAHNAGEASLGEIRFQLSNPPFAALSAATTDTRVSP